MGVWGRCLLAEIPDQVGTSRLGAGVFAQYRMDDGYPWYLSFGVWCSVAVTRLACRKFQLPDEFSYAWAGAVATRRT